MLEEASNAEEARKMYLNNVYTVEQKIRKSDKGMEKEKQREILGFKERDIMLTEKQSVLKSVMDAFEGENMKT